MGREGRRITTSFTCGLRLERFRPQASVSCPNTLDNFDNNGPTQKLSKMTITANLSHLLWIPHTLVSTFIILTS